jgi:hypothetical protein
MAVENVDESADIRELFANRPFCARSLQGRRPRQFRPIVIHISRRPVSWLVRVG